MPNPIIGGVSPSSGSTLGGAAVTINGANFTGTVKVSFGGVDALGFHVVSPNQLTATSPPHAAGSVDIVVTNGTGPSALSVQDQFLYAVPVPTVNSVFPNSGPASGGTLVTINGTNFTGVTGVQFGGTAASSFSFTNDNQITAISPSEGPGTVDIQVTTANGTSVINPGDHFLFQTPPAPFVSGINPASGPTTGGTTVIIMGGNFLGASGVTFGGTSAGFVVNSNTQITATAPAQPAGPYDVQVTTPNGTSAVNASDVFRYVSLVPVVASVSPTSGAAGIQVMITGSNFSDASAVAFGSVATSFTVMSSTQVRALSPAHASGTVDIIVTNSQGTSAPCVGDQFLYP